MNARILAGVLLCTAVLWTGITPSYADEKPDVVSEATRYISSRDEEPATEEKSPEAKKPESSTDVTAGATKKPETPSPKRAGNITTRHVALVDIIVPGWMDVGTRDMMAKRIGQSLHVPLNGTLHRVEMVDEELVDDNMKKLYAHAYTEAKAEWEKQQAGKKHPHHHKGDWVDIAKLMKPLADKVGADLVICVDVEEYYQHVWYGGFHMFAAMAKTCWRLAAPYASWAMTVRQTRCLISVRHDGTMEATGSRTRRTSRHWTLSMKCS